MKMPSVERKPKQISNRKKVLTEADQKIIAHHTSHNKAENQRSLNKKSSNKHSDCSAKKVSSQSPSSKKLSSRKAWSPQRPTQKKIKHPNGNKKYPIIVSSPVKKQKKPDQKTANTDGDYLQTTLIKMRKMKGQAKSKLQTEPKQGSQGRTLKKVEESPCRNTLSPYIKCTKSIYDESVDETVQKNQPASTNKKSLIQKFWSPAKSDKIAHQLQSSLTGGAQYLENNSFFSVNFRVISSKIMQIEINLNKRSDSIIISLRKGSLECQSIHEKYENLASKTSITVMSAVHGCTTIDNFVYPEVHIQVNEKNGTFGFQKRILLPFAWLNLVTVLAPSELTSLQKAYKIKNKAVIDNVAFHKVYVDSLLGLFSESYHKTTKNKEVTYTFAFKILKDPPYILRLVIRPQGSSTRCSLECESSQEGHPTEVLKAFDFILKF